ncbi:hypothetical protein BB558_002973 [Smittium angustum]|uniref:Dipeptidyl-peptidase V n=1 Tax=Smittium angustum TaxID=133377 RepID=A0A2U1J794_SMIAN|nr:hypothetical protein BB558_002973 [Smittium angustum]
MEYSKKYLLSLKHSQPKIMKFQGFYFSISFIGLVLADFTEPNHSDFPDWGSVDRFTPDHLVKMKNMNGAVVSPNKSKLVYSQCVYESTKASMGCNLRFIDLNQGYESAYDLTQFDVGKYDTFPIWINDNLVAFISSDKTSPDNISAVSIVDKSVKVIKEVDGISGILYSSIAKKIAFTTPVFKGMSPEESSKESERIAQSPYTGVVYDKLPARNKDSWVTDKKTQLFTVDLNIVDNSLEISETPINVVEKYTGEWGLEPTSYSFSPDGKNILFTAKIQESDESWINRDGVFTVRVDGSDSPTLLNTLFQGSALSPVYSPDGKYIAWLQKIRRGYESDKNRIILVDVEANEQKRIASNWDKSPDLIKFSDDSSKLYLRTPFETDTALFSLDLKSEDFKRMTDAGSVNYFKELEPDSILVTIATFKHPETVFILNTTEGGKIKQVNFENSEVLDKVWLSHADTFWFTGALNQKVQGMVLYPYGFNPSKKYPVALLIHGGPHKSSRDDWEHGLNANIFANQGYLVLIINFHGSDSYNKDFTDSVVRNWGSYPYEDLMKGLDFFLESAKYADRENVVALGTSYGGYMANWINGNTQRFKALVTHAGVFNLNSFYYSTDELFRAEHDIGIPWDENEKQALENFNPEQFVYSMKTPTLVIHGELDYHVPITEGISTFTALQRRNIESRFLYFPNDSNGIYNLNSLLQWYSEILGWIGKHTDVDVWKLQV